MPAGEPEHGRPEALQSPTESRDVEQHDGIRARIAALPGRIRRGAPLSHEDSAALKAAFQANDLAHVQVHFLTAYVRHYCIGMQPSV